MRLTRAQAAAATAQAAQIHTDEPTSDKEPQCADSGERNPLSEIGSNAVEPATAEVASACARPNEKKKITRSKSAQRSRGKSTLGISEQEPVAIQVQEPLQLERAEITPEQIPTASEQSGVDAEAPLELVGADVCGQGHVLDEQATPSEAQPSEQPEMQSEAQPSEQPQVRSGAHSATSTTKQPEFHIEASPAHIDDRPARQSEALDEHQLDTQAEAQSGLSAGTVALPLESPSVEAEEIIIAPQRTQVKNLLAKDVTALRSTSNKENEQPFSGPSAPDEAAPLKAQLEALPANTQTETHHDSTDMAGIAIDIEHGPLVATDAVTSVDGREDTLLAHSEPLDKPSVRSHPLSQPASTTKSSIQGSTRPLARPSSSRPSTRPSTLIAPGSSSRGKQVISNREPPKRDAVKRPLATEKPPPRTLTIKARPAPTPADSSKPFARRDSTKPSSKVDSSKPLTKDGSSKSSSKVDSPKPTSKGDSSKAPTKGNSAPAHIPHSKPRPMSLSFPTPPPPPKSTRPATKPTFQLPGEAIAAKLKAAREERLKKEGQELENRRVFKARPAPKVKECSAPVRQTASSRARESLMLAKQAPGHKTSFSGTINRASSVRESKTEPNPSVATTKRFSTVQKIDRAMGSATTVPVPLTVIKRASTVPMTKAKSRSSSVTTTTTMATTATTATTTTTTSTSQGKASAGTKKGKEVFQRAVAEKEALEQQKREKEEATRRARAAAAERGRAASREWADKMKLKSLMAKDGQGTKTLATTAV